MIDSEEKSLVQEVLAMSRKAGASDARVTLNKSSENLVATLDGEIDKVTRCEDRSIFLELFLDGKFGSFSTNRLDMESLERFIKKAAGTVRMLAPDEFRKLPDMKRCCTEAKHGDECGIYDKSISGIKAQDRCRIATEAAVFGSDSRIVSEEGEYSDCEYFTYLADTRGLECNHMETSFDYGVELTARDDKGRKYCGYWWHSSPFSDKLEWKECGRTALEMATGQFGSEAIPSGKYNMVVSRDVASKMVSPILSALGAYSIQQNNSFLVGSLGKKMFPEGLTILDMPIIKGESGSKLFDSEGVASMERPIIRNGIVENYFINTYMSGKLSMEPTIEAAIRPKLSAWPTEGLDKASIMNMCGSGILVTEFNGGNSNSATGDFSYGIEGYLFNEGKIVKPVSEMLVTGNYLELWKNFLASGSDSRSCMSKLIPTLAFSNVDFNG